MRADGVDVSRRGWPRPTVFRWLLIVAIAAIALHLGMDRYRERRERLLRIADNYARLARNYRDGPIPEGALWHEQMQREFESAADRPWSRPPEVRMMPPPGWSPPRVSPGP